MSFYQKELNLAMIQLGVDKFDPKKLKMSSNKISPCSSHVDIPKLTTNNNPNPSSEDIKHYYCDKAIERERAETRAQSSNKALKVLYLVSACTIIFIILEMVGGIIANSLAIMTDAFHMISDLASFMISIMAIKFAIRKPNIRYSYGYQRAEVLGAMASIIMIWVLTGILIYMAIERIIHQEYDVEPNIMMITAGIGVLFNLIIGAILYFGKAEHSHFGMPHNHDHGHDHGHDHHHHHKSDKKCKNNNDNDIESQTASTTSDSTSDHGTNINIRAAFVHVLGDLVQSVGVLVAAIIIKFTEWEIADPICTFLFSILVLITTGNVVKDTVRVLMECAPSHIDMDKVQKDLLAINGVIGVHSLRCWSLKMDTIALSVHLDTVKDHDVSKIVFDAHQLLQHVYNIDFVTVQAQCSSIPPPVKFELTIDETIRI